MSTRDILRLALALIASALFFATGSALNGASGAFDISSVGGQTIDEAFYQAFGGFVRALSWGCYGMSALSVVLAIPGDRGAAATDAA